MGQMDQNADCIVSYRRFNDETTYSLGTYTEKIATKLMVALAGRVDVQGVAVNRVRSTGTWGR